MFVIQNYSEDHHFLLQSDSIYGDIGGVIGLWLGLSFIAVFEIVQLAMDALVLCITVLTTKKKRRRQAAA